MRTPSPVFARVILDSPLPQLDHPFDYSVPLALQQQIRVGQKVVVPLRGGKRRSDAWVIELPENIQFAGSLSPVESIVTEVPVLPQSLYRLARDVADRQAGSAVDVLRLAIPPRYVRAEKSFTPHNSPETVGATKALTPTRTCRVASGGVVESSPGNWIPRWSADFALRAQNCVRDHTSVILVVPDFRDISYCEQALVALGLGAQVVRLDAGQSGQARWVNYLRILSGETVIVLGNRSAVYAPVARLGMIALWNDGDDSMHEPLAPYAHPRDVALMRQSTENCSLLFASYVPSVAVARLVGLKYLDLEQPDSDIPKIVPADSVMRHDQPHRRIPSELYSIGKEALNKGPVLVQVAKPGFASTLRCTSCQHRAQCRHCSGPLSLPARTGLPACRWCAKIEPQFKCRECGSHELQTGAAGSEKIADELGRAFPGTRIIVGEAAQQTEQVAGAHTLVVATPGTEPVAASGYSAVFILDGETARARESIDTDIAALNAWMTAAALVRADGYVLASGTGADLGAVLASRTIMEFLHQQVKQRESLGLPPSTRLAVVTATATAVNGLSRDISELPIRGILGPAPVDDDKQRLIVTFDYKQGQHVAAGLRALVVQTAQASRKPVARHERGMQARVSRISVRMDEAWLSS